jgi:hypothetical protein
LKRGNSVFGVVSTLPIRRTFFANENYLARNFSAFSVMTMEMTQTSFNLDESIKETVFLAEEGIWS